MVVGSSRHSGDREQVDRILHSHALQGSESLRKLLSYLAARAIEHPGEQVKEAQIALDVFGRRDEFDPRIDSTVRVQAARLRSKLLEYYSTEGASDGIIVEIPKGNYMVSFARPKPPAANAQAEVKAPAAPGPESRPDSSRWRFRVPTVLTASLLSGVAAASIVWFAVRPRQVPVPVTQETVAPVLRDFWKVFLNQTEDPWIIFSNAAFVGNPVTGLRYLKPGIDDSQHMFDDYTGTGEVLGIHELDGLFSSFRRVIRVKRGQLLSLDDVKNYDVIFVGSPAENLTLNELTVTKEFEFRRLSSGPRQGDLAVINHHPQPGEQPSYVPVAGRPLVDDYSIVALVPGITPPHWFLLLAGTTTLGTQAAVEYVCHANTLSALMNRLGPAGASQPFEVLLHVKITRGVPVEDEIVAVRTEK
ncbi:MAG: helix-turn-helix domain-containing protein [Bryobacteraceae bacterium]